MSDNTRCVGCLSAKYDDVVEWWVEVVVEETRTCRQADVGGRVDIRDGS
jgi:hypothetical protein